jgi:ribosomal protein L11 methylase PrmA
MTKPFADAGSFRDPDGTVYELGGEIYRTVSERAGADYAFTKATGLFDKLIEAKKLVATSEVDRSVLGEAAGQTGMVLRHERVPFISYPYEWSFPLLKSAALHHLDIQIAALKQGVSLSDASAYNIQFNGPKPIFIDLLSFKRYRDGEVWTGHRQFCEQFLNPLLLRALFGIPHNNWFRGALEGIETDKLARMMPWWRNFSFNILTHVTMQARLQAGAMRDNSKGVAKAREVKLTKDGYLNILRSMKNWIRKLSPRDTGATVWQNYAENTTYRSEEQELKRQFVADFCDKTKPGVLWDVGCNTGEYSEVALQSGARKVIGFDFDQGALERAHARATAKSLDLLPLFQDGANPSPDQGWANSERKSVIGRGAADAMIALAFEHHLAIGRNVPLPRVVDWLVAMAPRGVIEFVQKSDPTVQQLLALREDIFPDYTIEAFEAALAAKASIVRKARVSEAGRTLYWFDRGSR